MHAGPAHPSCVACSGSGSGSGYQDASCQCSSNKCMLAYSLAHLVIHKVRHIRHAVTRGCCHCQCQCPEGFAPPHTRHHPFLLRITTRGTGTGMSTATGLRLGLFPPPGLHLGRLLLSYDRPGHSIQLLRYTPFTSSTALPQYCQCQCQWRPADVNRPGAFQNLPTPGPHCQHWQAPSRRGTGARAGERTTSTAGREASGPVHCYDSEYSLRLSQRRFSSRGAPSRRLPVAHWQASSIHPGPSIRHLRPIALALT